MNPRPADAVWSILSHAAVEVRLSEIATLRETPSATGSPSLPKRFLRHCDEQTVVGMAAVLGAIDRFEEPPPSFSAWSVVSASCQAGRFMGAAALVATRLSGAQGVAPHVVPQCSLHSAASAVSVGLGMHGPHFGLGGGQESFDEAILSASAFMAPRDDRPGGVDRTAGLWLVLTAWDREPALDPTGKPVSDPKVCGLAVAARAGSDPSAEARVHVAAPTRGRRRRAGAAAEPSVRGPAARSGSFDRIRSLAAAIEAGNGRPASVPLRFGFSLQVRPVRGVGGKHALEAA